MKQIQKIFGVEKPIIGMIHVKALSGTPSNKLTMNEIIESALTEAQIYKDANINALMIENMHDIPYLNKNVGPEIVASMTAVAQELKRNIDLPMGIQILAAANKEALAVAQSANFEFIRAEGFVFGHLADEGYIDSCAAELLRYRKNIGAQNISIFTDIKKKHSSHSISQDVSISETAKAAAFFDSDGVIITGSSTGSEASENELLEVKKNVDIPVIIGSGISISNIEKYLPLADAFIIGSAFKKNGFWKNDLDAEYISDFMKKVNRLRKN